MRFLGSLFLIRIIYFACHMAIFKTTRVILTSYRSCGSSFAGNLIQQATGSFYYYEPFRKSIGMDYRFDYNKSMAALAALESLFTCANQVFTPHYWMDNSMENLLAENVHFQRRCVPGMTSKAECNSGSSEMRMACLTSVHKVVKTVRLPMEYIAHYYQSNIAENNRTLQVVYLLRDPRAIINSRQRRSWCRESPACMSVLDLCTDMRLDYAVFKRMKELYPKNFWLVALEDIAADAENEAQILFKALKFPYTRQAEEFVQSHTKGTLNKKFSELELSTIKDSGEVAFKWRKEMPIDEAMFIENYCFDTMDDVDYQVYNRKPLKLMD